MSSEHALISHDLEGGFILPVDHDPRYSFENDIHLAISSLNRTDNGTYECAIISSLYPTILTYHIHLEVLGKFIESEWTAHVNRA